MSSTYPQSPRGPVPLSSLLRALRSPRWNCLETPPSGRSRAPQNWLYQRGGAFPLPTSPIALSASKNNPKQKCLVWRKSGSNKGFLHFCPCLSFILTGSCLGSPHPNLTSLETASALGTRLERETVPRHGVSPRGCSGMRQGSDSGYSRGGSIGMGCKMLARLPPRMGVEPHLWGVTRSSPALTNPQERGRASRAESKLDVCAKGWSETSSNMTVCSHTRGGGTESFPRGSCALCGSIPNRLAAGESRTAPPWHRR